MSITTNAAENLFIVPDHATMGVSTTSVVVDYAVAEPVAQTLAFNYDAGLVTLTDAEAVALLNAFSFTGGTIDPSGNTTPVSCIGVSAPAIEAVLAAKLPTAAALEPEVYQKLETDLLGDLNANAKMDGNIAAALRANNVINAVELANPNLSFTNANVVFDFAAGALATSNMLTIARAMQIYRQLPEETLDGGDANAYMDSAENPIVDSLPMLKGQILVFGYNVALGTVAFTGSESSATSGGVQYTSSINGTTIWDSSVSKQVIFRVKLGSASVPAPFTVLERRFVAA